MLAQQQLLAGSCGRKMSKVALHLDVLLDPAAVPRQSVFEQLLCCESGHGLYVCDAPCCALSNPSLYLLPRKNGLHPPSLAVSKQQLCMHMG